MLKEYLKSKGITIYSLSKKSGISYSTLNDLVNSKVEINNCKVSLLKSLAHALDLSLRETLDLCEGKKNAVWTSYGTEVQIGVKNKSYHAKFVYGDESVDLELCKVREETTYYLDEIAAWRSEEYIRDRRLAEWE